jgi:polyisoprenoid-binding protein YceI
MKEHLVAIAALLASAVAAHAAPLHWTVDRAKSRLGFTVQWSGEPFVATFKSWNADIAFDPADPAHSKATVTIDLASEGSNFPDNDEGLKGPQGFDTSRFPLARFETGTFVRGTGNSYVANGTLALHGIAKHITLPFTLAINGKTAHVVGRAQLLRPDFGLAAGAFASENPIAHAVTVTVDLTASRP